jgi:beta-galactosidase
LQVSVYTTCSKVQLELNDNIIDTKIINPDSGITARFEVPYRPGTLKATGFINGAEVAAKVLKTSGSPAVIRLITDQPEIQADRRDLVYVSIEVADDEGNRVPNAEIKVNLSLSGEGELLAAGNAAPDQMSSVKQPRCITYRSRALAILRPTSIPGTIKLTAIAEGLIPASVNIRTK